MARPVLLDPVSIASQSEPAPDPTTSSLGKRVVPPSPAKATRTFKKKQRRQKARRSPSPANTAEVEADWDRVLYRRCKELGIPGPPKPKDEPSENTVSLKP